MTDLGSDGLCGRTKNQCWKLVRYLLKSYCESRGWSAQMKRYMRSALGLFLMGIGILLGMIWPGTGWAAEVLLPAVEAEPGKQIEVPVKLEGVENLAGMKLVLSYDSEVLQFQGERKPAAAQSLMHIVNPKIPGKLIVVMAGAKGIQIKNGPIIYLIFKVSDKIGTQKKIPIKIEEVQLMTDQLKNLNPTTKNGEVVLIEKGAPKPSQKK